MGNSQTATITKFDEEQEDIILVAEVDCWNVERDEEAGQDATGITFALPDGTDLTISEETLAALGYARA